MQWKVNSGFYLEDLRHFCGLHAPTNEVCAELVNFELLEDIILYEYIPVPIRFYIFDAGITD